jgi:hypothetical protein
LTRYFIYHIFKKFPELQVKIGEIFSKEAVLVRIQSIEDTYQPEQDKRRVLIAPPGSKGVTILLARASKPEQESFVGNLWDLQELNKNHPISKRTQ